MGNFLVDPVREITTRTGRTSLILLMLTLSCTPLTLLTGWRYATQIRRPLGLYTALYVGLHLFTFIGLDYRFDWGLMFDDIGDQRYVLVGAAAAGILALLTLTSTRSWQRRLGRNWKRLHRLVYLAGVLAVVHFLWLSKDPREPLRFALLLAILLAFRLSPVRRGLIDLRTRFRVPRRQPWGI
jgi:Predicted membrane protein